MQVKINGNQEVIRDGMTILEFLKSREINLNVVVVEHNYTIIDSKQLGETVLSENDTLEVVSFVGGG